ncbi:UNC93-like protein isoform X2 [Anopheles ziemanni]|uniref:UNC93-like protein isoform X2 n=1 Tax=Anopheles coustani TaxID=139045 RepID=UPI00265917F3|nr:UNC93-like protein isoform X2 [Anopheles coustani]XP_058176004.1 UNC93-like protein isoform X2 [Anopheles ziemanni]
MHGGGVDTDKVDSASLREKVKLRRGEKWRILKNIITVSFAFMVQFTAFQGTANLQSSINAKDGLGTVSLSAIYAALVVSCIFLPTLVIRKLTVKWTLCVSMLCYAPYIASQFYPRFYTLVPAGILLGLGAAPMWASKATYLTQLGQVYAKLTDQSVEAIIVRFFGFFFLAWQTAELWGNLISSLVLSSGAHGAVSSVSSNGSEPHEDIDSLSACGANFCVVETSDNANLQRPPDSEIFEISAIYLSCIVAAVVIIAVFLDPLSRYGERRRGSISATEISGMQLLSATFKQLKKVNQQLLILITVFIGMEQAFIGADFTQAYVSCALGIHQIGYVMICFGVVNAICSIIFGSAMKYIGRVVIIILGAIVHGGCIIYLLYWRPHPDHQIVFFILSGLWGIGDAVWQTQINGLYGALFRRNKEAAFSNYRLWESVGFVIAYAYSTQLCARMKLYLLFGVLVCGMIGYTIVEIRQLKKEKRLKELEEIPKQQQTEADRKAIEDDDEKDELEEDIVVTHL